MVEGLPLLHGAPPGVEGDPAWTGQDEGEEGDQVIPSPQALDVLEGEEVGYGILEGEQLDAGAGEPGDQEQPRSLPREESCCQEQRAEEFDDAEEDRQEGSCRDPGIL